MGSKPWREEERPPDRHKSGTHHRHFPHISRIVNVRDGHIGRGIVPQVFHSKERS